jgi:hypothetical protein
MQRDNHELSTLKQKLTDLGQVAFNPFDLSIRKNIGYLVPIDFYFEDLVDVTTFEKVFEEVEKNIADFREKYKADYDFENALSVDVVAYESFYEVTCDFWFEDFSKAIEVAEQLDILSEDIFSIVDGCYIFDFDDED